LVRFLLWTKLPAQRTAATAQREAIDLGRGALWLGRWLGAVGHQQGEQHSSRSREHW